MNGIQGTLPTLRGKSNVDLAEVFHDAFPLSGKDDDPTTLLAEEFDAWAEANHFYHDVNISDRDALNAARSALRYRVNKAALGDVWRSFGNVAFEVSVLHHRTAETSSVYEVRAAVAGFVYGGGELSRKIKRTAQGRRKQLKELLDAADFSSLPLETQIEAKMQMRAVNNWSARAELELDHLESGFRELRHAVESAAPDTAKLLENGD